MSPFTAFAFAFVALVAGAVTLVIYGHPWFATALIIVLASMRAKTGSDDDEKKAP